MLFTKSLGITENNMNSTVNEEDILKRAYARQKAIEEGKARKAELERVEKTIALDTQVGGNHYQSMKIQPIEYTMANKMNPLQHTVIKYVSRYQAKNGIEDLKKAIHSLELLIQFEEAK
tara:strand:+ start:39 stop:395 length:357 start_codon:yes stop_codon:yes gene_type:complete